MKTKDESYKVYQLTDIKNQFAFYFEDVNQNTISVDLPAGNYSIDIISMEDGAKTSLGRKDHKGGEFELEIPSKKDFALRFVLLN